MAKFVDPFGEAPSGFVDPFSSAPAEATAPLQSSGLRRAVADPAISLARGVIGVPEAIVGLADIPTLGGAGKAAEALGFRPREAKEFLGEFYSPEYKQTQQELQATQGFFPTIQKAIEKPSIIAHGLIESLPSIGAGGAVARGALAAAPRLGFAGAGAVGEGAVSAGATAEEIRQQSKTGYLTPAQSMIAAVSGGTTGAVTAASAKLANKFGLVDVEQVLAGKSLGQAAGKGAVRRVAEGFATEGAEELLQSAQEQLAQNIALGQELGMGVGQAAALGMLTGGLLGGGVQLVRGQKPEAAGTPPTEQPLSPEPAPAPPAGPAEPLSMAEFIRSTHVEAERAPMGVTEFVRSRRPAGVEGPVKAKEVKAAKAEYDAYRQAFLAGQQAEYEAYKQAFIDEQFGTQPLTPEQRNQIIINQTPTEVPAPAPAEAAPELVQKTRIAEPAVIGEQPAPAPAAPIITVKEAELLRIAEKETGYAPDQVEVQRGVQRQRGEGAARGQTPAAGAGDRILGAAQGDEGRAQSVETKVALLKRQRGELLTNREAKLVRDYEKAAPAIETPAVQTQPRYRGRQFGSAERRENFVNAYSSAVDTTLADLTAQGVVVTPNKLRRAASLLKRSAEAAVTAKDDAAGATILDEAMGKALRGIIPKAEIEVFRQKLADATQAALPETLMSKGAMAEPAYDAAAPATPGYVYHVTTKDGYFDIRNAGKLDIFDPGYGTDQAEWPDGAVSRRAYFSETPKKTEPFQQERPVLLRVKRGGNIRVEITGDLYSEAPIAAKDVEYFGTDGAWHSMVADDQALSSRAAVDAAIIAKSDEIRNVIAGMVGTPKDLVVEAAPRVAGGAGMIQFGELRDMITVSLQASDAGSVAAHEGFHYLDKRVLTGPERRIVRQAFASGSRLHRMLVAKAEAYDSANGTDIASEIRAIPAEARAYGFEFWRRGELEAQGMIAKVFQKLAHVMERIRNYIDGLGFTSYEDLFAMIRRGEYAQRDLSGIREFEREVMRSRAQREASEKAFYSALAEAVADIRKVAGKDGMIAPAQAKTWLAARQKEGRFKAAELEAVGLAEWLDLQPGKVSVDDIETFVREHGVQVEETVLGVTYEQKPGVLRTSPTKFHEYQLPGGTNYRELLLRLPSEADISYKMQALQSEMDIIRQGRLPENMSAEENARFDDALADYDVLKKKRDTTFRSSHFDQPNILAHVRFNERTDADGKRVLFLEELQSDWAQKGRKEGFDIEPTVSRLENGKWQIQRGVERTELPPGRFKSVEEAQAWATENYRGRGEIPSAPFVTETKAWVALALKRMIRYAAENGFDRVAWTTGEQQAARYDLSKQVDKIVYFKNKARPGGYPDGTYNILVTLKDSDQTVHREGISIEQVEADVGKDIAKQVADNAGIGSDGKWYARDAYHYAGEISGAGLKVGGEGMKAFYDRIVPQVANELLKKFGGGKVGEVQFGVPQTGEAEAVYIGPTYTVEQLEEFVQQKRTTNGWPASYTGQVKFIISAMRRGAAFKEAVQENGSVGSARELGGELRFVKPEKPDMTVTQPGFDITPALRGEAMAGLPLFSKAATESIQDIGRQFAEGDLQREQVNAYLAAQLDRPDMRDLSERLIEKAGVEVKTLGNSLRRIYHGYIGSGLTRARASQGYANVFGVMTHFIQRKAIIFERAIAKDLSTWVKGAPWSKQARADKTIAFGAMLKATVKGLDHDSAEYHDLMKPLTQEQRAMVDQAWAMIGKMLDAEFVAEMKQRHKLLVDTRGLSAWVAAAPEGQATVRAGLRAAALAEDSSAVRAGLTPQQAAMFDQAWAISAAFNEWVATRKAQVEHLKKHSYVPERRYGDHFVHAYVTAPDGKPITVYYEQYEREAGALEAKAELDKIFAAEGLKVDYGFKHKVEYDGSISISQFLDLAQRHGIALTQVEKERLGKALIAADSTRRNRLFRRQNVAGYSQDGMRVLAEFAVSMSNKIAYAEMGDALQDALQGRQVDVAFTKEGTVAINTQADTNLWKLDGPDAGFFRNLADEKVGFVMSPESRSTVSNKLRALAVIYFLGGSIAAAGVNLSSLPMITLPWLTQHANPAKASAALLEGMRLAGKHFNDIRDLPTLLGTKPLEGIDNVEGLRHALQIAAQDGSLFDTEIYQFMGLSRGQEYSLSGRTQEAVKLWMTPFRLAEQYNRVSAYIAAYKVAKSNNLDNEAAAQQAQEAVYGTQFRYDEANRPALADSGVGSLFFVFKSFPIFMMETMTFLAKTNPKSAVFMLGMLVLMAGVEGLPFAEDLEDLIDVLAQRLFGEPFNSKRWLRNTLKNASEAVVGADLSGVLMHGVANTLTGLNFASRVGAGNLIPGTRIGAADSDYRRAMDEILGPVGSMVSGIVAGGDALSKGDFLTAAKKGLPLAAKNAVKGWEQFEKGYATDAGGRKLVDVGSWEAFWQSLGFSSSALAQVYESDSIDRRTSAFYTEIAGQFTKEMVAAIRDGDRAAANEVGMAVVAWNQAHPDMPIAMSPASIRRQVALAGMPLNQRTLLTMPRYLRGQSEAAIGLAAE